jgi:hypothetical protein
MGFAIFNMKVGSYYLLPCLVLSFLNFIFILTVAMVELSDLMMYTLYVSFISLLIVDEIHSSLCFVILRIIWCLYILVYLQCR